jgi:vibriolysin
MITRKMLRGLGMASVVAFTAACQGADEGPAEVQNKSGVDVQAHLNALPGARVMNVDDATVPTFVRGNLGSIEVEDDPNKADLRDVIKAVAPVFGASAASLVLKTARTDKHGVQHFRFSQVKNGREVIGAELALHARDGIIVAANGSVRDDAKAPVDPTISAADAIREARDSTAAADVSVNEQTELAYFRSGDKLHLVYPVDVTGTLEDGTPVFDTVLVDAIDGSIVRRLPHIHSAKDRSVHNTNHTLSLPGPLARAEGGPLDADAVVNTNYDLLGSTYDCYANLFGRDSFDAAGATLISTVHYDYNYVNAFWDGVQMVYGDGDGYYADNLALSMDVTAHELTHAVTQYESGLYYAAESGGLNEAMSDIFGNVCEWYRNGQVVSADTWLVGQDIWTPGIPGDALRYMNNPSLDGASLDYYPDYNAGVDVHYSSGIANLAFYLLSEGGSHPQGKTSTVVNGIGLLNAAWIFYYANAELLTPTSTFADAKAATALAAELMGFPPELIASVDDAWDAVGVGEPLPPPTVTELQNNVPVDVYGNLGSQQFFSLEVPAGTTDLSFITENGYGDADLFVRYGDLPSGSVFDCYSGSVTTNESCQFTNPPPGTYYVMVYGYSAYDGVSLVGSYVDPTPEGHLVINEVDYDQPGTADTAEFVEIFNGSGAALDLSTISLLMINGGNNSIYHSVYLGPAGALQPGQYLVVGAASLAVAPGALKINFSSSQENRIQNGAPDGLLLFNNATGEVIDALSYEGIITAANIPGVGAVSLVEGTPLPSTVVDSGKVQRSLGRFLNGTDTDNAATDWAATSNPTPGSLNVL